MENPELLKALVWREVEAVAVETPDEFAYATVAARVKGTAAQVGLAYDVTQMNDLIDVAFRRVSARRSA